MPEDAPTSTLPDTERRATRSQTRGFLFADIRGYTKFVERRGASEAADLLLRYRSIVRDAINRNDGAEIRTEGDSFYVVLPSASDAVLCGLAIVDGVAEENAQRPDKPIRVGVGVHAGEAIDTAEGLVGGAVNVAARVCALAGPDTVLVTDTVRSLALTVIPVAFLSRGRRRLRGVAQPVQLYAAVASTAPRGLDLRPSRRAVGGGVAVLAVVAAGLVYAAAGGRPAAQPTLPPTAVAGGSASPSATAVISSAASASASNASPSASPAGGPTLLTWHNNGQVPERLRGGAYQFTAFQPTLSFVVDPTKTVGDDWWMTCGHADYASLGAWDSGVIIPGVIEAPGTVSQCDADNGKPFVEFVRVGSAGIECTSSAILRTPEDLVQWMSHVSVLTTSQPRQITFAGFFGLSVDAQLNGDVGRFCGAKPDPARGLDLMVATQDVVTILPGDNARFVILDIGQSLPLVIHIEAAAPEWSTAQARVQAVFNTLTLGH